MQPNEFEINDKTYSGELILEKFEPTWTSVYRIPVDDNIESCSFTGDSIDMVKNEFPEFNCTVSDVSNYVYIVDRPLNNDEENNDLYMYQNNVYDMFWDPDYFYKKLKSVELPKMVGFESENDDITEDLCIWLNPEIAYYFYWKFNVDTNYTENLLALILELEEYNKYVNNVLKFDDDFKKNDEFGYIDTMCEYIPKVIEKLKTLSFETQDDVIGN